MKLEVCRRKLLCNKAREVWEERDGKIRVGCIWQRCWYCIKLCDKKWLSKAILISHRYVYVFTLWSHLTHSSHMTHTCLSLLCSDWLMFCWLTIVSYYDVMTFAHDSHRSNGFHACNVLSTDDLLNELWFVYGILCSDLYKSTDRSWIWLTFTYES